MKTVGRTIKNTTQKKNHKVAPSNPQARPAERSIRENYDLTILLSTERTLASRKQLDLGTTLGTQDGTEFFFNCSEFFRGLDESSDFLPVLVVHNYCGDRSDVELFSHITVDVVIYHTSLQHVVLCHYQRFCEAGDVRDAVRAPVC